MDKKEMLSKLNAIYADFDYALSDESIMTIGKKLDKIKDELSDFIQEIEDSEE